MSSLRIRPRFKEEIDTTALNFKESIQKALDRTQEFTGLISERYCVLKIRPEDRHYWSPQLTLTIEQESENHLTIRGLYGPKPSVWAVFFMSYAAIGVFILFIAVYGLSKFMLNEPAHVLWGIPILGGIALILYLVAQGGQKVGAEQMFRIHHFYEEVMKHKTHIK